MEKKKTTTGFEFHIDDDVLDDMELLENIVRLDTGDMSVLTDVIVSLLGKKQKEDLYEHCRGKNGRVSAKRVLAELGEIFEGANNKLKNS